MENRFLLIIGAHQDTEEKNSAVIDLLKYLKKEGIDVCFSTHSSKGLEKISEISKYLFYDSDNTFLSEEDLINSLDYIDINLIETRWIEWFNPSEGVSLLTKFASCPHQRSALKIVRNGVSCASDNGYEWVAYIEYDVLPPKDSLKKILEEKIQDLSSLGMDSFLLWNQRNPYHNFLSGGFWITRTKKLTDNQKFLSSWHKSSKDWYINFGTKFFEEIVEDFIIGQDRSRSQIEGEIDFWTRHWGDTYKKSINIFDLTDSEKNYEMEKILAQRKMNLSFYVNKNEETYSVEIWVFSLTDDVYCISDLKINEFLNSKLTNTIEIEEFEVHPYGWRILRSYDNIEENSGTGISISCTLRNKNTGFQYKLNKKIASKNLEKLHRIKTKIFE